MGVGQGCCQGMTSFFPSLQGQGSVYSRLTFSLGSLAQALVRALQVSRDGVCVAAGAPGTAQQGQGNAWGLATVLAVGLMFLVTLWTFACLCLISWYA